MARRIPAALLALVATAGLAAGGCGTLGIHRPQDLANAQRAQSQLAAADLSEVVAAERKRLADVLAEELALVREHTLARRDARLLYVIGEGDTAEAWVFLAEDIAKRFAELGVSADELDELRRRIRRAEVLRGFVEDREADWEAQRARDPDLPRLDCPPLASVARPEDPVAAVLFDDYGEVCDEYLGVKRVRVGSGERDLDTPLVNAELIAKMIAARDQARAATRVASDALATARQEYARSLASGDPEARVRAAEAVAAALGRLASISAALEQLGEGSAEAGQALTALGLGGLATAVEDARSALDDRGLGAVVSDLGSVPAVAALAARRDEVLAGLSEALEGETASKVLASLRALGAASEDPSGDAPLTRMVLLEAQLRLDVEEARRRENFYDRTLVLLETQEQAYRDELLSLARAERLRRELDEIGCLTAATADDPRYLERMFTGNPVAVARCRERVFRLLVHYAAAWTLGRVESEQVDYRLIALHHESALDTSDIAFRRWASLLEPPVDQLVALYETGLRPESIVAVLQALGVGAIAVGVN